MPNPVTLEYRLATRKKGGFNALYSALLLLSFHWAIVLYINAAYLEQFVDHRTVSMLFVLGALCTISLFVYASPLLTRLGNTGLLVLLTILEIAAVLGLAYAETTPIVIGCFLLHLAIVPILMFNLDIYMEELIGEKEGSTGGRRGLLLSLASLTGAFASLAMGKLMGTHTPQFEVVYVTSAFFLIPFLYIILTEFRGFKDPQYPRFQIFHGLATFWRDADIRSVLTAHFLLQFFFAWMVIYTPMYLSQIIGFNWEQIGIILFAGLFAYVLLEYLIGYVADAYIGEKEMMAFGFAVTGIATSWFIFLDNSSVIAWMIAMFMTRVGASFVETTTESYFFKHTEGKDTNVISLFRITRPLSYVIGAVLGGVTMHYLPDGLLFVFLGLLMVPGMFCAFRLNDTK